MESQIAQKAYSRNSDIFNNYYRLSKEEFKDILKLENLAIKQVEQDIANLTKSSFVLKEELVVHRGYTIEDIDPVKLKKFKGFISTSLDKAIAMGYARNTGKAIAIIIPKGTPIMYLREHSKYPNHMEILIPPEYYITEHRTIKEQIIYKIAKR